MSQTIPTATQIIAAFASGEVIADDWAPMAVDEGQGLLVDVMNQLEQAGATIAGFKIGLTSGAARDAFGKGVRPFGFILADRVFDDGATIPLEKISRPGLENEIVFKMGTDPGPDADAADARDAINAIAPAFEINEERVRGRASPGLRVAENLSQWGLITGPWKPAGTSVDSITVTASRDDQPIETVDGAGHIDDHYASIAHLARALHAAGSPLRPGTLVITGSYTRFRVTEPGRYTGDFGDLGIVSAHLG